MFSHCVLSVDYSADWDKTLEYLPAIKSLIGFQRLTLVHVIEIQKRHAPEDNKAAAQEHLKGLADKLANDLGVTIDYAVRRGFPASETLDVAREVEANAVITLNKSHSSSQEFLLGNIAMNLARLSRLPLLILSLDGTVAGPDAPIILATDGSDHSARAQQYFETLVQQGKRGLAAWVEDGDGTYEETVENVLKDLSARYDVVAPVRLKGSVAAALDDLANSEQAALIIAGKRGTTPIVELLLGRTAETIARQCRQPVLLVP